VTGRFDITDQVMKWAGQDPYAAIKSKLADETREQRLCMARRYQGERQKQELVNLSSKIRRIAARLDLSAIERRRLVFEIWDECLEESDAGSHYGVMARATILSLVREVFPEASVLKLGWAYPFPDDLIRQFSSQVQRVLVIEELDDFLEEHIKALGIACDAGNVIPRVGELSPTVLRAARAKFEGRPAPVPQPRAETQGLPARPPVLCPGCPHRGIFYALTQFDVVVTGDIGCYSLGVFPPLNRMDTILCMGAGISMTQGFEKAGEPKRVVGIVVLRVHDS